VHFSFSLEYEKGRVFMKKFFKEFILELSIMCIVAFILGYISRDTSIDFPYIAVAIIIISQIIIYILKKHVFNRRRSY
jgi:hypothetical protein